MANRQEYDSLLCWFANYMKRIFTSPDSAEVGLVRNLMEKAGIRCFEKNEQMAQTIPAPPFQAELWVVNEADYASASAIMGEWLHPTHTDGAPWICSRCGERLGSQFGKCWKCGTRKDAA